MTEILNGEKLAAFIQTVQSRKNKIEKCGECGYRSLCAGGCPAEAYIENGTIYSVSSRCMTRKSHFNAGLSMYLRAMQQNAGMMRAD